MNDLNSILNELKMIRRKKREERDNIPISESFPVVPVTTQLSKSSKKMISTSTCASTSSTHHQSHSRSRSEHNMMSDNNSTEGEVEERNEQEDYEAMIAGMLSKSKSGRRSRSRKH